ncbi:glutathione S-transferase family protein [Ramlibacter albus]|uniref:Glutathione S-transferase family protein n=1 Tax=Ramlibacter albus TaxID=2079448 RepID=A0A923M689_9BURK|nr:glutathione S-transferase family protein [Ramlibacter albus]MBC5764566.1 glutathione S-transferase family protein [Ramlibacter albus]
MLTVHHLTTSQSERVLWLCEELGIDYTMVRHERLPDTRLAPPSLRALTPMGTGPVMQDGDVTMSESGAIVEYIIHKYGGGRLALPPSHPDYAQYLYWFHFANASLQPVMGRIMMLKRLEVPQDHAYSKAMHERLDRALRTVDARVQPHTWLAGSDFTAADIMTVFSLTTMRIFAPVDLGAYAGILAYLQRVGARPAYRRAMAKGDPGMEPLLA